MLSSCPSYPASSYPASYHALYQILIQLLMWSVIRVKKQMQTVIVKERYSAAAVLSGTAVVISAGEGVGGGGQEIHDPNKNLRNNRDPRLS